MFGVEPLVLKAWLPGMVSNHEYLWPFRFNKFVDSVRTCGTDWTHLTPICTVFVRRAEFEPRSTADGGRPDCKSEGWFTCRVVTAGATLGRHRPSAKIVRVCGPLCYCR